MLKASILQLPAAIADPALTGEPPISEPLHVQHDFGADLLRLGNDGKRLRRRAIQSRPIERARLDARRNHCVFGLPVGRHPYIRRRPEAILRRPCLRLGRSMQLHGSDPPMISTLPVCPRGGADTCISGQCDARALPRQARASADLERVKTLLEPDDTGLPCQMRMFDCSRGC